MGVALVSCERGPFYRLLPIVFSGPLEIFSIDHFRFLSAIISRSIESRSLFRILDRAIDLGSLVFGTDTIVTD